MFQFNDIPRLTELELADQRVLVRADLDEPADHPEQGRDSKIEAALPTLRWLLEKGIAPVVAAHRGPAKARRKQSLEDAGARFAEALQCEVYLPEDNNDRLTAKLIAELKPGRLVLLENLSWDAGEFKNDEDSARQLSQGVGVFAVDALEPKVTASLVHAPRYCPQRCMGLHLEQELVHLKRVLTSEPGRSVWCVGDSFVEQRTLLRRALELRPIILAGAALARTLLAASGKEVQLQANESELVPEARTWLEQALDAGTRVVLPKDLMCGNATSALPRAVRSLVSDEPVQDLGPDTVAEYQQLLLGAESVLFLDHMGAAAHAANATRQLLRSAEEAGGFSYVVSSAALRTSVLCSAPERLDFVSTSRAGVLALLSGQRMPSLEALRVTA